ncbi:MAG: response regulator transcription factor [Bacteroidetes bacterium]|nr:response regulator transcription factor [Bacteroidota bacterium]
MSARCLIVDDEPLARKLLASHVAKTEGLTLVGECGSAMEALKALQQKKIDLLFLDIQMPEFTGLQLIRTLTHPPAVILTTAHRDFAADAFDLNVLDYLLKPISFDRFLKAVNRYFNQVQPSASVTPSGEVSFFLRSDRKLVKVPFDQVMFVESLDDQVAVHMTEGTLFTRENITHLAGLLPEDRFVRIHRAFIVSKKHISSLTKEGVEVGKRFIPFGRAFRQAAWKLLGVS